MTNHQARARDDAALVSFDDAGVDSFVEAEVVGHGKEDKIYVFKFKRRKNYRRKTGHRQKFTEVRITDVKVG